MENEHLSYDAKGFARLPKDYKPSPEETAALKRASSRGMMSALTTTGIAAGIAYYFSPMALRDPILAASARRSFLLASPLIFMLSFSGRARREASSELGALPNSPLGEACRHNKEIMKNFGAKGIPPGEMPAGTQPQQPAIRRSAAQPQPMPQTPSEFDRSSDLQNVRSQKSEFEYEGRGSQSTGGYYGGLDADVPRAGDSSGRQQADSLTSATTLKELRNKHRTSSPQPQYTAPAQPNYTAPQSSHTSSKESFVEEKFKPSMDTFAGKKGSRGQSDSKYGDSGFS